MIKTAIVGLGWWGRHLAGCLIDADTNLELVQAVDPSAAARGGLSERYGIPIAESIDTVLHNDSVEAVILATPHSLHEQQILACAQAGKHVFCEKPLALSAASARRAIDACDAAGVVLGVGHERRFEPAFAAIKRCIANGELGTLMHLEANFSHDLLARTDPADWRASPQESPIPVLSAMAIHLTDAYLYLCGPIAEVFAYASNRCGNWGAGDVLTAQLQFESGITGSLSTILVTPMFVRMHVFGSNAWMEARSNVHPGQPGITRLLTSRTGERPVIDELDYVDSVAANLKAFAAAVTQAAPYPISTAEKFGNIAVMEAIIESAQTGHPARPALA